MVQYIKDKPIILYSKLVDDVILEEVNIVILRPSGDRHSLINPTLSTIEGFGTWYSATLNLRSTDELGKWTIRWVYKTANGEIISEYSIDIVHSLITPYWCFQPRNEGDQTLPDDVKDLLQ